jgi:CHAT domain-containing protein/tetratricopeptide (TPR) repeat protein
MKSSDKNASLYKLCVGIGLVFLFISSTYPQSLDTLSSWELLNEINKKIAEEQNAESMLEENSDLFQTIQITSYSAAKLLLIQAKSLKKNGTYEQAFELLKKLENEIPDKKLYRPILPDLYHEISGIYLLNRDISQALYYAELSIEERIKLQGTSAPSLFKTYTNLGTIYQALGKAETALSYYTKAMNIKKGQANMQDQHLAMLYQNMGRLYYLQKEMDSALYFYQQSLRINEDILGQDNYQLGVFYSNFGVLQKNFGNYEQALDLYKKAENIFLRVFGEDNPNLYSIYSNIGNIYRILGEYQQALRYYKNSIRLTENDANGKFEKQYSIYMNIAAMYINFGYYQEAIDYLKSCEEIKEQHLQTVVLELPYTNLAICYTKTGQYEKAQTYYIKQIQLEQQKSAQSLELASAYWNYGNFCLTRNYRKEALKNLLNAKELYKQIYQDKHPYIAQSFLSLAEYYLYSNPDKALTYLQSAIIQIIPDFNNTRIQSNPTIGQTTSSLILLAALRKKAKALYISSGQKDAKKLELALSTLKLSFQLSQQLQASYMNDDSKLVISSKQKKYTVLGAQIAFLLYQHTKSKNYLEDIYQIAERNKSAILLSYLQDIEAKNLSNIPLELSKRETEINKQYAALEELILKENEKVEADEMKISNWNKKLFMLSQEKEMLLSTYQKEYPDYYNLRYNQSIISLKDLQKKLRKKEALIEYIVGDSILISLCITSGNISGEIQAIDSQFYTQIEQIRNNLVSTNFGESAYESYISYAESAFELYTILLARQLQQNKITKLAIVPDHVLSYIPFEVLLKEKADYDNLDYRKLHYLIHSYTIRYTYSATLGFTQNKQNRTKRNMLAMAPAYGNYKNLDQERMAEIENYTSYLVNLPGVSEEIESINKSMKAKAISGKYATERLFKENAEKYGILHLAMHTILNEENPMYSKLVFYLNNDSLEDGMLNTYELYNMNLNANLAVLSACNTGYGSIQQGEGVMSLARGFIGAGCPNIIMTLWALEDKSGLEIMKSFYAYFSKSKASDIALRKAKLDYLNNADKLKSHPYFWSTYVMIGNPVSLRNRMIYFVIVVLVLVVLIVLFFRHKKGQQN